jgi:hypothetical protein
VKSRDVVRELLVSDDRRQASYPVWMQPPPGGYFWEQGTRVAVQASVDPSARGLVERMFQARAAHPYQDLAVAGWLDSDGQNASIKVGQHLLALLAPADAALARQRLTTLPHGQALWIGIFISRSARQRVEGIAWL